MNPLDIEKLFNQVEDELKRAGSERVQLFLIYEFLQSLERKYQAYDSYLIQLFELFPSLEHPLLFTGLRPADLEQIITACEEVVLAIPELEDNDAIHHKIDLLKTGLNHMYDWLGISNELGKNKRFPSVSEAGKGRKEMKKNSGEVFIPVVEYSGKFEARGRLRKLSVEVVGESRSGTFELRPVFGVIGANTGDLGDKPAKTVQGLIKESIGRSRCWSGTAKFEMSHTWHAGNSANLALSGLFYCEILKAEKRREYFQLNPGIAITGDIDEEGNVLSVDQQSLRQKAEASFFSWAQVLVVPIQQLEATLDLVEELQQQFPNRELVVKGVGHLKELFYDRRLSLYKQISLVEHTAKKVWDKKYSASGLILLLILLGAFGRMVYGPMDRNPTHATYSGENAYIRNQSGAVLREIFVGKSYVNTYNGTANDDISHHLKFFDVDNDGINEVFENKSSMEKKSEKNSENFLVYSLQGDTLYKKTFELDIPFDNHPYVQKEIFYVRKFDYADLDGDGKCELALIMSIRHYFTSLFVTVDVNRGKITDKYVNAGYLRDLKIKDLDRDGINEVLLTTELKGYKSNGIVILDGRFLSGKGILGERYQKSDMQKAVEKVVLKIPQTIVGKTASRIDQNEIFENGFPNLIILDDNYFTFLVDDWFQSTGRGAKLLFQFYNDLTTRAIVSADSYDNVARELYEEGELPYEMDAVFLDTYRDSLEYWDGSEFVRTPTLNKQYLEAVGKDSIFYKEFFFEANR